LVVKDTSTDFLYLHFKQDLQQHTYVQLSDATCIYMFSPDVCDGCHGDCLLVVPAPVSLSEVERLPNPPQPTSAVHPGEEIQPPGTL
jgi:hypothetical protein